MLRTLVFTAALALAAPALAQSPEMQHNRPPATLSVSGSGHVSVAPDMATMRIGVETRADTAAAAVAANNASAERIIDTLKQNGIEAKDIQTSNFSVSPVYDETTFQRREGPKIVGYQATNQVVARIHDLDGMGTVLDATVGSGANRIDGLEFGLEDDTEVADQARAKAVEDALRKARVYAQAAGVQLGDIQSINESGGGGPVPMYAMAARAESAPVPIERGQTTVSANVQIVWEIHPAGQ